jgi:1-acyl-sn-glycerol-3-phosphate acyltransferase
MFYQFLKILVGFTLRIFFKKIFITGVENVKNDRAQLIASNHPNGFLEPLIMACFFPKDLHFLVRGDVFDNPFLRPILRSTHQIPIFRFRDGFSKLRENSQTMDESIQVLLDKKNLLIFAEGGTESIKKLRPLQKGIARIAFQALDKNPSLDLEVLPVGINFTYPAKFNKEVMMRVSEPIKVRPFYDLYLEDKNKGIDALLKEIYDGMKKNIIHLEHQDRLETFEQLALTSRSQSQLPYLPVYLKDNKQLDDEKAIAFKIDNLHEDKFSLLKSDAKSLLAKMKKDGVKWSDLTKKPMNILNIIILTFGLIPALLGFLIHLPAIAVGHYFTKSKVKQKEFKASILMVVTLVMMLLQYVILFFFAAFSLIPWYILLVFILSGLWLRFYVGIYSNTYFKSKVGLDKYKLLTGEILAKL